MFPARFDLIDPLTETAYDATRCLRIMKQFSAMLMIQGTLPQLEGIHFALGTRQVTVQVDGEEPLGWIPARDEPALTGTFDEFYPRFRDLPGEAWELTLHPPQGPVLESKAQVYLWLDTPVIIDFVVPLDPATFSLVLGATEACERLIDGLDPQTKEYLVNVELRPGQLARSATVAMPGWTGLNVSA